MTAQDVLGYRWQYDGPVYVCRSGGEATGQKLGYQNAATQQGMANQTLDRASNLITGNPQQTPFYKSLLTSGTQATTDAYKGAQSNLLAKANQAGFGYAQPVTQGAQAELGGEEAGALGRIPAAATQAAEQAQLEQGGLLNQQAGIESGAAQGYFGTGSQAEQGQLNRNAQFWQSLLALPAQAMKVAYPTGV